MLATTTMLAATITSVALELKLRGPEFLGYCSTLIRDSRFFHTRYGAGSTMGGAERTRLFRSLRLKLLDVGVETGTERLVIDQVGGTKSSQV